MTMTTKSGSAVDDDDPELLSLEAETDLRAAVQHSVWQICKQEDEGMSSNNNSNSNDDGAATTSPHAIESLTELVYTFATTCLSRDLEAFAEHASRSRTIQASDVTLVLRKYPVQQKLLVQFLQDFNSNQNLLQDQVNAGSGVARKRRRSTAAINFQRTSRPDTCTVAAKDGNLSDASSSSDDGLNLVKTGKTRRKNSDSLLQDDSSSDSDAPLGPMTKKPMPTSEKKHQFLESDDDDDSLDVPLGLRLASRVSQKQQQSPKPRFRMANFGKSTPPAKRIERNDTSSVKSHAMNSTTQSRFDAFMTELSDDSLED